MSNFFLLLLLGSFSAILSEVVHNFKQNPGGRIIGGQIARTGQFPWQVAIYLQTADGTYFCGGTLVSSLYILTSASCVENAESFTLYLGSNTLETEDPNRVIVAAINSISHPSYNPETLENDVGLIKLHLPIEFNEHIQSLPLANNHQHLTEGVTVTVAGWGRTNDTSSGIANDLNYVTLSVITNTECQLTYGDQIKSSMVCAVGNFHEGICGGDTGGALVGVGVKGNPLHVGVASFMSGNGCETIEPSGFARTDVFHNWIWNIITQV